MARGHLDPIQMVRYEAEPAVRRPPTGRPRLGFQPDQAGHAAQLIAQTADVVEASSRSRRSVGISVDRLLVIRMRFLGHPQRHALERLQVHVVNESEVRRQIEQPYYELVVEFEVPLQREAFCRLWSVGQWGVSAFGAARGQYGRADERRLVLRFPTREAASLFAAPTRAGCRIPVRGTSEPVRVSNVTTHVLTAQFRDTTIQDGFLREIRAHHDGDPTVFTLSLSERADLVDALESVSPADPESRIGVRLQAQDISSMGREFALDVDVWHPGPGAALREAVDQLRAVVSQSGGRVTGAVREVARTLLIARVWGTSETLEALQRYDRVSRVDLPPQIEPVQFSLSDFRPSQAEVQIPPDAPLACLIDSGVVPGHPLLRGLVVDEEDFGSGDDTPIDRVGHGTHAAGILVYGDTRQLVRDNVPWTPHVRVISAKVLRRVEGGFGEGSARAAFGDVTRAEIQIEEAIRRFAEDPDRRCRVFNLSLGNPGLELGRGHQLPWALLLDDLARELDIVIVVSAGNATPSVPSALTEPAFQAAVRDQLFDGGHGLIDPASALNALTVGALSRTGVLPTPPDGGRPNIVAAPGDAPAPFTRTGVLHSSGEGPCRAVKPELVAYGGNMVLSRDGMDWRDISDQILDEPSLNYDFTNRYMTVARGTSVSAPYVTHVCSRIEHRMRKLISRSPSANLIRALIVSSASRAPNTESWLSEDISEADQSRRIMRAVGYGMPDYYKSCYSDKNRAILFAEGSLHEGRFHVYEIVMPQDFLVKKGTRTIRLTVAHDPPVRGTRGSYMSRFLRAYLHRGAATRDIISSLMEHGPNVVAPELPDRVTRIKPGVSMWSTVQSEAYQTTSRLGVESNKDDLTCRAVWHVSVACKSQFKTDLSDAPQRYAVVLTIEHSDEEADVHEQLAVQFRSRVTEPVRTRL